jgi:predicted glycoside hydrolase/deacetylase ChbG (UPF0249 family)
MVASGSPRLILCADDYAIAPGVSRAIVRLLAAGRISATGCMVTSRFWPEHAAWLRPLADRADIGLHLTLGHLAPLPELMRRAFLGRLPRGEIAVEVDRQVDAFTAAFGRPPAFIDGHQHVHQLPGIRAAVLDTWERKLKPHGAWLRVCDEPVDAILRRGVAPAKALLISALGWGLRRQAVRAGIPVNDRFCGVRHFTADESYPALFERFIEGAAGRLVVMCHPGTVDDELRAVDSLTTPREAERHFFESPAFVAMLARHGLTPQRFD